MTSKTILIIDRDLVSLASIDQMLSHTGHRILHTTDLETAREAIATEHPDLIICGPRDPDPATVSLLRQAAAGGTPGPPPILFVLRRGERPTASPDILGPRQYLLFPYSREEFLVTVNHYLTSGARRQDSA